MKVLTLFTFIFLFSCSSLSSGASRNSSNMSKYPVKVIAKINQPYSLIESKFANEKIIQYFPVLADYPEEYEIKWYTITDESQLLYIGDYYTSRTEHPKETIWFQMVNKDGLSTKLYNLASHNSNTSVYAYTTN